MSITYLFGQLIHLFWFETSICKHTNLSNISRLWIEYRTTYLRRDMAPIMFAANLFQILLQQRTHGDDSVSHSFHLTQPLLIELRVVKNLGSNTSAMNWWIRVQRSDEDLDLRIDALLLFGRSANNRECSDTFTIETLANELAFGKGQC